VVRRLDGCLGAISLRTRRVLVLRAGLGTAERHSRAGVAAVLDLTVRRVARIERRGVRTLRRLSRTTGCASSLSGGSIGLGTGGSTAAGAPPDLASFSPESALGGAMAVLGSSGPADSGDDALGGDQSSSSSGAGAVLGTSAEHTLPKAIAPITQPGSDLSIVVMLLALAIAAAAGVLAVRRELR
jgi:hypothetical protein